MSLDKAGRDLGRIRNKTRKILRAASNVDRPVLIESPPNSGKTTGSYELALKCDVPITHLTARIDLYAQAREFFQANKDINFEIIPSPHRTCESFRRDDGIGTELRRLYDMGFSGRELHFRDIAKTPCQTGEGCEYITKLEKLENDIDDIDFLIGHYIHAHIPHYTTNRIVVIDEFSLSSYVEEYSDSQVTRLVDRFLVRINDSKEPFPSEMTDTNTLLQKRRDPETRDAAIEWFEAHKVTNDAVREFDFLKHSDPYRTRTYIEAPFLTFTLLCMETLQSGVETEGRHSPELKVAPLPDSKYTEVWTNAGLNPHTRCVQQEERVYVFDPPDLSSSYQIIGLDGTPTTELWDLVFAPDAGFDHRPVIKRKHLADYLSSAMNMSLFQIGEGMYPYAGGRISKKDGRRFEKVQSFENQRFALITSKKALKEYEKHGWLDSFVKPDQQGGSGDKGYRATNFGRVLSSNDFEKESLGVVSGTPFPGHDVIERWAAFFGESVEPVGRGTEKSFGEFGDLIYKHLTHDRVIQAILRFGRHESVIEEGGAVVYVNTQAVPGWLDCPPATHLRDKSRRSSKAEIVIEELVHLTRSDEHSALQYQSVPSLTDRLKGEVTPEYVRKILNELADGGLVEVRRNHGFRGADLYRWVGDDDLVPDSERCHLDLNGKRYTLKSP
ncbi:hypothetical protein [Natronorarus salvus]|uniref:hypothetical protein n=1 Tax=Natronorarus salvus TaxID=3117733 RepID=UPI002F26DB37